MCKEDYLELKGMYKYHEVAADEKAEGSTDKKVRSIRATAFR
jgi:hypothetical protein